MRALWRAFPDARVHRTGDRLANERYAVAPAKLLGTHEQPLGRLAATRRAVVIHGVFYAELADGRFFRVRAFFDVYEAGVQLGALPKTGSAGERALLALRGFGLRTP